MTHRPRALAVLLVAAGGTLLSAQQPFLTQSQWRSIRDEASGIAAYENLRVLTRLHRVPATPEFDQAADFILQRAKSYGLRDAHAEHFPIDGKIRYGLMRSHLAWNVEFGSLWQVKPEHTLLGDWATEPIRLADYSHTADVHSVLIDVGNGTAEADYAGKNVQGKIVLADGMLAAVQRLAVMKHGAAGIVSDMPNQTTAWSGLDDTVIRWGHLDASQPQGFAFMVSRGTAASLRGQIAAGQPVELHAQVQATVTPGQWTVVTGTIPGTDPQTGEVVYSCHLDHQRPGANDNGSGCVATLEAARVLADQIGRGEIARPTRTLRFIWGPEVEGTMAFLSRHPDIRAGMKADIHLDMVGGDLFKNKSVLHVTETPWSLPSFVTDVGELYAGVLRDGAASYAAEGTHPEAATLETRNGGRGTRNQFFVDRTSYAEGSDHDDYNSSTIAVPSLYLRDWPDIYIHTDHDTLDQIDATKLRRVIVLAAAAGYTYASVSSAGSGPQLYFLAACAQQRIAASFQRALQSLQAASAGPAESWYEGDNTINRSLLREQAELRSFASLAHPDPSALEKELKALQSQADAFRLSIDTMAKGHNTGLTPAPPWQGNAEAARVPRRVGDFGPLTYQNDDVLLDRLGRQRMEKIKLLDSSSSRLLHVQDAGALYAYEIVNLVDGKRTIGQIRDIVSAEFRPVDIDLITDYLQACKEAGILEID